MRRRDRERFGGFVAKYMGDGVLIYFGYPQAHEDDAERAVRAGLECPSSNGLGQSELFRDGGSGLFGLEFRRLSTDVAIVAV